MNKLRFLLLLAAALGALVNPAAAAGLEGVAWTLTELNGQPFAAPAGGRGAPTLRFDAAKKSATGFSGVNRFFGGYERDGDKLKFGPLAGTRMAGPPEAMHTESAFLAALASVTGCRLTGGTLALLSEGRVVAAFVRRPAAEK